MHFQLFKQRYILVCSNVVVVKVCLTFFSLRIPQITFLLLNFLTVALTTYFLYHAYMELLYSIGYGVGIPT